MSFEKLKEYSLYIILSLFGIGSLVVAYLTTSNTQKGASAVADVQDSIVKGVQRADAIKSTKTINSVVNALNGTQLGSYVVSGNTYMAYNMTWDEAFADEFLGAVTLPKVPAGQLFKILIPASPVSDGITPATLKLTDLSSLSGVVIEDLPTDQARGYIESGYFGFAGFGNIEDAEAFRDDFVPNGVVTTDTFVVLAPIAQ